MNRGEICETCRYGLTKNITLTIEGIECRFSPNPILKKMSDWCFQWMPRFLKEPDKEDASKSETKQIGGCDICGRLDGSHHSGCTLYSGRR